MVLSQRAGIFNNANFNNSLAPTCDVCTTFKCNAVIFPVMHCLYNIYQHYCKHNSQIQIQFHGKTPLCHWWLQVSMGCHEHQGNWLPHLSHPRQDIHKHTHIDLFNLHRGRGCWIMLDHLKSLHLLQNLVPDRLDVAAAEAPVRSDLHHLL